MVVARIPNTNPRILQKVGSFVACFDLIPEAMEIAGISSVLLGILAGIVGMAICDILLFYSSPFSLSARSAAIRLSIIASKFPFKKSSIWKMLIPIRWSVILPCG